MNTKTDSSIFLRKFILYSVVLLFCLSLIAVYLSSTAEDEEDGVLQLHGWVEGTNVTLSAQVAGQLIDVSVEEGDMVAVNQSVFNIDSGQIRAQFKAAKAAVASANRSAAKSVNDLSIVKSSLDGARISLKLTEQKSIALIAEAEAKLLASQANFVEATALFVRAKKDYIRSQPLLKKNTISQSVFDGIEESYFARKAMLDRISREVDLSKAGKKLAMTTLSEIELKKNDIVTLERQVSAAEIAVEIANANHMKMIANQDERQEDVNDTSESSKVAGTVIDKVAEAGEYVVRGSPVVVIVDLQQLYIKTYVEQDQVGMIKLGDTAKIEIDSFPGQTFIGKVYFIAPQAEFTPRNIQMNEHRSTMVYKVKVRVHNPEGLVKPGLPADVKFHLTRVIS